MEGFKLEDKIATETWTIIIVFSILNKKIFKTRQRYWKVELIEAIINNPSTIVGVFLWFCVLCLPLMFVTFLKQFHNR